MADGRVMHVAPDWIERHCIVPDGFRKGQFFRLYDYQLAYIRAFYTVRSDAVWRPDNPTLAPAFVYRRGLLVGPQKVGKNPLIAAQVCLEGTGPSLFAGWAAKDDGYVCADNGCGCGWEYPYDPGEPMGMAWPTPLIQITAFSEDSTENTYDALRPMIDDGPLHDLIPKTGEEFIRLPGKGRIDTVTSSNQSRLGQRVTFVPQDELGLWYKTNGMEKLADTQYRNLAGMGGRASLTSNAWDPSQHSVAQREYESAAEDIFRSFSQAPKNLSYANKRERHKIHQFVYPADTRKENNGHVDLDAIEAEAADMAARDLPQAWRFFGNGLVTGAGKAFDLDRWLALAVSKPKVVPDDALVTIGFDGSRRWDHTALIATEVASGYQWPLGIWKADDYHGEIPVDLVSAAVEVAFGTWDVWRLYADPPYWEDTVAAWAGTYGKERVIPWWTNRTKSMAYALRAWSEAQLTTIVSHCAAKDPLCALFTSHVGNAYKRETGFRDDGGNLWIVEKDRPASPNKIDSVVAAALSWEARKDALTAGALNLDGTESAYDEAYVSPYRISA